MSGKRRKCTTNWSDTYRGVFATEGGRTIIRDGDETRTLGCHATFVATKQ
jgi:hypothetical protein